MKETTTIVLKALAAAVPYLGGSITTIWSDVQSLQAQRKMERLESFFSNLTDDISNLKSQLNDEYINKSDFLDIFENTANFVINERTEVKRVLFRNILVKGMTNSEVDFDKTEKYLKVVDEMDCLELLILKVLSNPSKYNEEQGKIITDPNEFFDGFRNHIQSNTEYFVSEILSKLLKTSQEDIAEAIYFLEQNRLVIEKMFQYSLKTNGHPIHALDNKLTKKGKDFVSYILT